MSVPVTHVAVVPPVLTDFLVSHASAWMEQSVTDVNVSNQWLCCQHQIIRSIFLPFPKIMYHKIYKNIKIFKISLCKVH